MKKLIGGLTVLIASMALFGTAFAAQGGEGNNTGCNGVGNVNSPCVGGQGGAGGEGGAGGAGGAGGSSASKAKAKAKAEATAVSVSGATGGAATATGEYTGGSYVGGDVNINTPHQAPAVAAPALTAAGTGVCLGSVSIGLSGPMAGASFGITKVDKGCELRSNAALLYQFGYKDAAVRLLMENEDVRKAMAGPTAAVIEKQAASLQGEILVPQSQVLSTNFGARPAADVQGN